MTTDHTGPALDPALLEPLTELEAKATPGQWEPIAYNVAIRRADGMGLHTVVSGGDSVTTLGWRQAQDNAEFIAAMRNALPALLAAARRAAALEADVARLRAALAPLDVDGKRLGIHAPEDAAVAALCERWGYGAVMDAAYRLWRRLDPVGAMLVGPCVAVAQDALTPSGIAAPMPHNRTETGQQGVPAPATAAEYPTGANGAQDAKSGSRKETYE